MNERIRLLAKQADPYYGNKYTEMPDAIVGDSAVQKFALLIVQECVKLIDSHDKKVDPDDLIHAIEKHFGVK